MSREHHRGPFHHLMVGDSIALNITITVERAGVKTPNRFADSHVATETGTACAACGQFWATNAPAPDYCAVLACRNCGMSPSGHMDGKKCLFDTSTYVPPEGWEDRWQLLMGQGGSLIVE